MHRTCWCWLCCPAYLLSLLLLCQHLLIAASLFLLNVALSVFKDSAEQVLVAAESADLDLQQGSLLGSCRLPDALLL